MKILIILLKLIKYCVQNKYDLKRNLFNRDNFLKLRYMNLLNASKKWTMQV